jgi:hypothetical protein
MPESKHKMLFLPRVKSESNDKKTAYCQWCVETKTRSELFKIRDGPIDWYFCDVKHAEFWLEYRHKKETHDLCRMNPIERREYLAGQSMEDEISRLFPDRCARNE